MTSTRSEAHHPDAVQFFDENGSAPHDIVVANNLVARGAGGAIEGIFLRLLDNSPLKFENVAITGNTLVGTMYDGITVLGGKNVTIDHNTLASQGAMTTRIWVGNSDGVTETANKASAFIYGSSTAVTFDPTSSNTHIVVSGNTVLAPVTDGGAAVISQFNAAQSVGVGPVTAAPVSAGPVKQYYPYIAPSSGGATHTIPGGSGNDNLNGAAGNDYLSGGAGSDTMAGGTGDDTYFVENAGDKVVEAAGSGIDSVWSSISTYTLSDNVENIQLRGVGHQTAIGNSLDNVMWSSNYGSVLDGGLGRDVLHAGRGADALTGGAGADVFTFSILPDAMAGHVTDFTPGADILDLRGIFRKAGLVSQNNPLSDGHLNFVSDGVGGAKVMLDADGSAGPGRAVLVTTLDHVAASSLAPGHDWIFT